MTAQITFPDVEAIYRTYLLAAVPTGTGVFVRPPTTLPGRFVTVRRVGGTRDSLVTDSPRLRITAWGATDADAWALAEFCRSRSFAMRGTVQAGVPVYDVTEFGGPVPYVDPESGRPTYFFTHQVRLRGAAA